MQQWRLSPLNLILLFLFILMSFSFSVSAQSKAKIDSTKNINISYSNAAWNTDSTKVNEAVLILRDATSKKTVSIPLQETEPDSSVFVGKYNIDLGKGNKIVPQLYIPNQQKMKTRSGRKEVLGAIKAGKIVRKPFLLTKNKFGKQSLDIFDTTGQAKRAFKAFKEGKTVRDEIAKQKLLPDDQQSQMDYIKEKEEELELQRQKEEELAREKERLRLEKIEKQKALERARKQKELNAAEKQRRKRLAAKLAQEGVALYSQGKFKEAKNKFSQSLELDPENTSFYYSYAITLYRTEDFNKSLVMFGLTKGQKDVNEVERRYYVGLNHFRLQEWEPALNSFRYVKESKTKVLSASSAFYEGLVLMQLKQWDPAKNAFQFVLDNSENPQLDQQAENYIEKIVQLQYFANKSSKRHTITADVAVIQDSNILLLSDSTADTTDTEQAGLRTELKASYEYRSIYTKKHELSSKVSVDYYYSLKDEFDTADPTSYSFSSPYSYKTKWFDKSYKLELVPGYDMTYLTTTAGEARENISNSMKFDIKNTFVMTSNWFTTYSLKLAQSDSKLDSSEGDDDADATSIGFSYSNILLVDKKLGKTLVQDFTYTNNDATGKNEFYSKYALTLIYLLPVNWQDIILSNTLLYSNTNYSKGTEGRKDSNYTLKFDFNKAINKTYSSTLSVGYIKNNSNIDTRAYDKYTITLWLKSKFNF